MVKLHVIYISIVFLLLLSSDSAPYYVTSLPNTSTSSPKRYLAYLAAFSRLATLRQVYDYLASKLRLRVEDMRLWYVRDEVRTLALHLQ